MKYYVYKVTFADLPGYFYYGKHKDNGKPYFGSPHTWKHLWEQFEPEVQVLQWFSSEDECAEMERKIILHTWKSPYSLNENIGGHTFSYDILSENGRRVGTRHGKRNGTKLKESKKGIFGLDEETHRYNCRRAGRATVEQQKGIHSEEFRNSEVRKQALKKSGEVVVAQKKGIHSEEYRKNKQSEDRKRSVQITNSQRWECLVTGYVSTPAGLSTYQRARNIDTSLRKKL